MTAQTPEQRAAIERLAAMEPTTDQLAEALRRQHVPEQEIADFLAARQALIDDLDDDQSMQP